MMEKYHYSTCTTSVLQQGETLEITYLILCGEFIIRTQVNKGGLVIWVLYRTHDRGIKAGFSPPPPPQLFVVDEELKVLSWSHLKPPQKGGVQARPFAHTPLRVD